MTRIKDWTVENLTEEQKEIHDTIVSGPRGHVVGPLRIWLNNPGLARSAQTVGEYARYCLLYTSPSPRDRQKSRMPSSA